MWSHQNQYETGESQFSPSLLKFLYIFSWDLAHAIQKTICYLLISIQASCGSDDHVAECESTEEAKTGNNKPFFCWQRKGRKSLWGEGLSQIDVNISLKSNDADVNGGVSPDWLKEVKQEEVCQRATNWRRLVEGVVKAARERGKHGPNISSSSGPEVCEECGHQKL